MNDEIATALLADLPIFAEGFKNYLNWIAQYGERPLDPANWARVAHNLRGVADWIDLLTGEMSDLLCSIDLQDVEAALTEAKDRFFNVRASGLRGKYVINGFMVFQDGGLQADYMADAQTLGYPLDFFRDLWERMLMTHLNAIFRRDLHDALVVRKDSQAHKDEKAVASS